MNKHIVKPLTGQWLAGECAPGAERAQGLHRFRDLLKERGMINSSRFDFGWLKTRGSQLAEEMVTSFWCNKLIALPTSKTQGSEGQKTSKRHRREIGLKQEEARGDERHLSKVI
jgi:hypothetical protein